MKKVLIFLFMVFGISNAISPYTLPWQIKLTGDTATVVKWKANNDTMQNFAKTVSDTLNGGVPRYSIFKNHLYIFPWMNIDTIPSADTINVKNITSIKSISSSYNGPLTGNVSGSISGGTISGSSGTFTSTINVDSLHCTRGGTFGGNVGIGTISPSALLTVNGAIKASSCTTSIIKVDSLLIGNGTPIFKYSNISSVCTLSLSGGVTASVIGRKMGSFVSIMIPDGVVGTVSGSPTYLLFKAGSFPTEIRPQSSYPPTIPIAIRNGGLFELGTITINSDGSAGIVRGNGGAFGDGLGGVAGGNQMINYIVY